MVFFTCDTCGSCLKKAQVDKHRFQCRGSKYSCMDCLKDFRGDEYKSHIKCISEEQKYEAVGWKPPPGHMKGEKKQVSWTETIRMALDDSNVVSALEPAVRRLLLDLTKHDNIPRKKPKFMNFVKNTTRNRFDERVFEKAWTVLENQMKKLYPAENKSRAKPNGNPPVGEQTKDPEPLLKETPAEGDEIMSSEAVKNKKKKSKRKDKDGAVGECIVEQTLENEETKLSIQKGGDVFTQIQIDEIPITKSKKKKLKHGDVEADVDQGTTIIEASINDELEVAEIVKTERKKKKSKRDIENSVVEGSGEISLNKEESKFSKESIDSEEATDEISEVKKKKKSKRAKENSVLEEIVDEVPLTKKKKKSKRAKEISVLEEIVDEEPATKKKKKSKREKHDFSAPI